jgi:IS5 family transposase
LLKHQTRQKLRGEQHIEDRLVSLDELDARPIKKGKAFPKCEFGTTNQMSFNRQGFMVSAEIFIGKPADSTLYISTLDKYQKKMKAKPPGSITDQGYRAPDNFDAAEALEYACFGKLDEVPEEMREFCKSARSATEGFIAAAKSLRGMGKSLYRGVEGDKCWAALGQTAYNLKKFYQLYCDELLTDLTLQRLGFIT